MCGELGEHDRHQRQIPLPGSSPRVRGTRACCVASTILPPVHPRVCGELRFQRRVVRQGIGSSPRVRGTRPVGARPESGHRFIPACAGNSLVGGIEWSVVSVHPRVCGELASRRTATRWTLGSSPRVRGTHEHEILLVRRPRFIPACAGNSPPDSASRNESNGSSPRVRGTPERTVVDAAATTVHPRVCGELADRVERPHQRVGSSPRVRGTPAHFADRARRRRFIPACAGNSATAPRWRRAAPVHPRVCGELARARRDQAIHDGSSPRVRGTPRRRSRGRRGARFIPACAGNSRAPPRPSSRGSVHPRVCGELDPPQTRNARAAGSSPRVRGTRHPEASGVPRRAVHPRVCGELLTAHEANVLRFGSSPRVRGTRPRHAAVRQAARFIPACAGNSRSRPCARRGWPVHPRVCGELAPVRRGASSASGSSPRVRGTLRERVDRLRRERFIPACAGNSG